MTYFISDEFIGEARTENNKQEESHLRIMPKSA